MALAGHLTYVLIPSPYLHSSTNLHLNRIVIHFQWIDSNSPMERVHRIHIVDPSARFDRQTDTLIKRLFSRNGPDNSVEIIPNMPSHSEFKKIYSLFVKPLNMTVYITVARSKQKPYQRGAMCPANELFLGKTLQSIDSDPYATSKTFESLPKSMLALSVKYEKRTRELAKLCTRGTRFINKIFGQILGKLHGVSRWSCWGVHCTVCVREAFQRGGGAHHLEPRHTNC